MRLRFTPAAQVTGSARFRLINPPPIVDGLPSRKKIRQGILPDFRKLAGFDGLPHNPVFRI